VIAMNELRLHATYDELDYQDLADPDGLIRIAPGKVSVTQRMVSRGAGAEAVAAGPLGVERRRSPATSHAPPTTSDPFDFSFSSFGQPCVSA
jgi:hypothetical protein